ncbi:DAK2 domain-containing protein [Streptomyces sp. SKN60]|uniref:DAK2 domain-containing protein n=1 Tax=Streptomyces sp. SKN60 TaxID=2855506 RepID=UPI002245E126|nr:DAK2 domain-containing protein [Streptomyces sp. SKN60]MCX2181622.1 DAK2 domain-containing protein [Streptomyces sp. SKN60]
MPRAPQTLDAETVRSWCAGALAALGRERAEIDAINVYPVADGDTGTNLYLTVESAARAVDAADAAADVAEIIRIMAHGALLGARGNSGTILSQLLRGMAVVLAEGADGDHLARALANAAGQARQAVAHPVEGTLLTVADAAAGACAAGGDLVTVAERAYEGARAALDATPGQLDALRRAGVVDAGGAGLVAVLGALLETLTGEAADRPAEPAWHHHPTLAVDCAAGTGPAYEVIYLLEAGDEAVDRLRGRLDALGESLVVVGGDGLWNVHVHVDDAGAAVEAGVEAGRPYRIRVTHFESRPEPAERAVVAVLPGEGLAGLCTEAGATTLVARPGETPTAAELTEAIRRAHAREIVLLPNDTELREIAAEAAEHARREGIRVALIPTRAAVQGIAALAVHEPERRFDEDVVAMTAAAGATRYAELGVAARQSFTSAGVCQAGDVLGLIEGDVAVIGRDLTATAVTVLDRMLSAGGELVTVVVAADTPDDLADTLERHVRTTYLAVDTTVYHAGEGAPPLLIGVE